MSGTDLAAARRAFEAGDLVNARDAARRAATADPRNREAFAIWGISAAETGALDEALQPLAIAAQGVPPGAPGAAPILVLLARCLARAARWREALAKLAPFEARPPADPILRARLGTALAEMQVVDRALPHLRGAVEARPDAPDLLYHLGSTLVSLGRFDEAEDCFERALAGSPTQVAAPIHLALARMRRWTTDRNHVDRLRSAVKDVGLDSPSGAALHFALFKELDDLGRTDEAWPVLQAANVLARKAAGPWSSDGERTLFAALAQRFPVTAFRPPPEGPPMRPAPIFVVGLPRTGTTLVERILGAHSQVRALGELPFFPNLFRILGGGRDKALTAPGVARMKSVDWRRLGIAYLEQAAAIAGDSGTFTDKTPFNSLLIGPIRLALPGARVVLLRRGPMDALFSAHQMWLPGDDAYRWSHRLEDLADHFRHHQRLMTHWRDCLGEDLIEVSYEDLVVDPEPHIRRLLDACGLAFEPACLRPETAPGAVRTLSSAQARAPIAPGSVGRWRRYEAGLAPLRARLRL